MRYSIIIPSYNGLPYIKDAIASVLKEGYTDYELIVSDDHSEDGTPNLLNGLIHPNLKVIYTPKKLSMAEHWEWALSHAAGEWIIFVGQDDGLQSYFFELANRLVEIANREGIRTIMSERAYYFWPGCEDTFGDYLLQYEARPSYKILDTKKECYKALVKRGLGYFDLPEMYTTSLFHKSVLSEAKALQGGRIFSTHPQDANLAAIACRLEKKYLRSYIPLGWVGSSPKSAGFAVSSKTTEKNIETIRNDYLTKISSSDLKTNKLAGNFSIASIPLYFWNALLQTDVLGRHDITRTVLSRSFKRKLLCNIADEVIIINHREDLLPKLINLCSINGFQWEDVFFLAKLKAISIEKASFIRSFFGRNARRIQRRLPSAKKKIIRIILRNNESERGVSLIDLSEIVNERIRDSGFLNIFQQG